MSFVCVDLKPCLGPPPTHTHTTPPSASNPSAAPTQVQAYERRLFTAEDEAPLSALQSEGGRTLLQDLLCAGMHSRAAYGYAMAAGHISTVTGYIKLKTLAPFT